MQAKATGAADFKSPILAPHLLLFIFYNLLYFLPLLAVFLWGYSGGGAEQAVGMDAPTMVRVTLLYSCGVLSFAAGTLPLSLVRSGNAAREWRPAGPDLRLSDKLLVLLFSAILVVTKVALIPLGVYHEYAFTTGEMSGGTWSFSMFCSETMVLLGIVVLFSRAKHNVLIFICLALLNGINLLHGSRIFTIVTIMAGVLYAYLRGYLSVRRVLLYGPLAGVLVLAGGYLVFLNRSGTGLDGGISVAKLFSPIVYESLFSQIALVDLLRTPSLWEASGHVGSFFSDVVLNTTPRFIVPDKDQLLFFSEFNVISPLGAMNGYAAGLVYFGFFFPLFYFIVGFVAQCLYLKAKAGPWWFILYAYFASDFLFRIMRDGYLIPIKMMINALQLIVLVMLARILFRALKGRAAAQAFQVASTSRTD